MNGKQARRIRKLAMEKAHSYNDTTLQGVKARKIEPHESLYEKIIGEDKTINIVNGHKVQRKLHEFSLKSLSKKVKKIFRSHNPIPAPAVSC